MLVYRCACGTEFANTATGVNDAAVTRAPHRLPRSVALLCVKCGREVASQSTSRGDPTGH